ncbi:MAG: hypothetical protein C4575_10390 [Desulforudis sp.]|jgi:hypothetical protein|nr:MAG: hypothetical protein C4575_10390 [Desulforudis sp.]
MADNDAKKFSAEDDLSDLNLIAQYWGCDWLGLVVGSRYFISRGFQIRLALSISENSTDEMSKYPIFPVRKQPGDYVFLLHNVCIEKDGSMFIVDCDLESYPLEFNDSTTGADVRAQAITLLDSIPDEEYRILCAEHRNERGEFGRTTQPALSDFKIIKNPYIRTSPRVK